MVRSPQNNSPLTRPVYFGPPTLAEFNAAQTWSDTASLIAERAEGRSFLNKQKEEFERLAEEAGRNLVLEDEVEQTSIDREKQEEEDFLVCYLWETVGKCANRVSERILTNLDYMRDGVLPAITRQITETEAELAVQMDLRTRLEAKVSEWREWESRVSFVDANSEAITACISNTNELAEEVEEQRALENEEATESEEEEDEAGDDGRGERKNITEDGGESAGGGIEVSASEADFRTGKKQTNVKKQEQDALQPVEVPRVAHIRENTQYRQRPEPFAEKWLSLLNDETKYNFLRALWLAFRNTQESSVYFHDLCVPHEDFRELTWGDEAKQNYDGSERYDPATFVEPVPEHLDAPWEDRLHYALTAERAAHDIAEWSFEYQAARIRNLPRAERPDVLRIRADPTRAGSRLRTTELPLIQHSFGTARMLKPDLVLSSERAKQEQRKFRVFQTDFQDLADDLQEVVHPEKDPKRLKLQPNKTIKAITFSYEGRPDGHVNIIPEKEKAEDVIDLSILQQADGGGGSRKSGAGTSSSSSAEHSSSAASSSAASSAAEDEEVVDGAPTAQMQDTKNLQELSEAPFDPATKTFLTEGAEDHLLLQDPSPQTNINAPPEGCADEQEAASRSPGADEHQAAPPLSPSRLAPNIFHVNPTDNSMRADLTALAKERSFHGAIIVHSQHVALPGMKSMYERLESNRKPPSALLQRSGHQKQDVELDDGRVIQAAEESDESGSSLQNPEISAGPRIFDEKHQRQIPLSRKQVDVVAPLGAAHTRRPPPVHSADLYPPDLPSFEQLSPDQPCSSERQYREKSAQLRAKHDQSIVHVEGTKAHYDAQAVRILETTGDRVRRRSKERTQDLFQKAGAVLEVNDLADQAAKNRTSGADRKRNFMARSKTQSAGGGDLEALLAQMSDEDEHHSSSSEGGVGGPQAAAGGLGGKKGGKKGKGKKGGKFGALQKTSSSSSPGTTAAKNKTPFGQRGPAGAVAVEAVASSSATSSPSPSSEENCAADKALQEKWHGPDALTNKKSFFQLYQDLRLAATLPDWKRRKEYYLLEDLLQVWTSDQTQERLRQQKHLKQRMDADHATLMHNEKTWRDVGKRCWRIVWGSTPEGAGGAASSADGTSAAPAQPTREQQIRERRRKRQTLGKLKVVFDNWYMVIQTMLEEAKLKKEKKWSLISDYDDARVEYFVIGGVERLSIFGDAYDQHMAPTVQTMVDPRAASTGPRRRSSVISDKDKLDGMMKL
ncbi:unnamed protein product [Amoebophrya sp. A120]|nr:unnamed protein product [Amoebophrya sp. A120]|eukprot:GSA120T00019022001.1